MDEYLKALCEERHRKIEEEINMLRNKYESLDTMLRKKIDQIMWGICATMLTIIASLFIQIANK